MGVAVDQPRRQQPPAEIDLIVDDQPERAGGGEGVSARADPGDARVPQRTLGPRVPVIAITLGARAIDLGGTGLALVALAEVAARAVATFSDAGALTVVRPGDGPSFLFPLAQDRDDDDDEVVRWCRAQDDEQTRHRVVALAERFQQELDRSALLRDVLVEVRLGEGVIVGAPARAGRLLPGATWRPA